MIETCFHCDSVQGSVDFRKAFCYGCQLMTKELLSVPQMVKGCMYVLVSVSVQELEFYAV